ncbi:MAG: phosphopentomutase, partial [Proteobacteria bacterium]
FANLVDFDMLYGHRRDAKGYAREIEWFDEELPSLLKILGPNDLLILTADHGNDPTFPGSDHTREYVPLLAWCRGTESGGGPNLGTRETFADIGQTILDGLGCKERQLIGTSFLHEI